ncbi:hypothetical protein J2X45_001734 [Caulobacter sp. BE264]|uniref:hypothetical protein n=1 Tax=Caulobacter sp. BE264 TaxID=2817724 RepID=UPI00285D912E|nr:hypothetical protein [Caulobacter sp. BE264]MDR7230643.1 hypothetical protein [Caulobacter sp. BE264]
MSITTDTVALRLAQRLVAHGVAIDDVEAFAADFAPDLVDWVGGEEAVPVALASKVATTAGAWNADVMQRIDWWTGTVDGGPNGDGMYPMTNAAGVKTMFPSLAKIFATVGTVGDPAAVISEVQALVDDAEGAKSVAEAARDQVVDRIDPGISLRDTDSANWALVVLDKNDKSAGGWKLDGTFAPVKILLPDASQIAGRSLTSGLMAEGVSDQVRSLDDYSPYAFVVHDAAGNMKLAVPKNGPVMARVTKALRVEALDPGQVGFNALADEIILEPIENDSGQYALLVLDQANNIKFAVPKSGPVIARVTKAIRVETIDDGQVGFSALASEIPLSAVDASASDQYALLVLDQSNKIKFAVPKSGPVIGRVQRAVVAESVTAGSIGLAALAPDVTSQLASNRYVAQLTGSSPTRKLFVSDRKTGRRVQITATDPADPKILDGSYVAFVDGGEERYQSVMGGATWPVYPTRQLTLFGDSLTNAGLGVSNVGSVLGITAVNRGISGQGIADIAIRQGGLRPAITVSGNTIPASGVVAVTAISPATGYRVGSGYSFVGTLAGVAGTLARDNANAWTFTRTADGADVACPPGSLFVHDAQSLPAQNDVQSIWVGRNNVGDATFLADLQSGVALMVGFLKPLVKRYAIISVTNGQSEGIGTSAYQKIADANAYLAATYGDFFYDLRSDFIQHGLTVVGLTASSDDLAAIAADKPPPSLMGDSIHPNNTGYAAQKLLFAAWLTSRGYFL